MEEGSKRSGDSSMVDPNVGRTYYYNHFKLLLDHILQDGARVCHVICPSDSSIEDSSSRRQGMYIFQRHNIHAGYLEPFPVLATAMLQLMCFQSQPHVDIQTWDSPFTCTKPTPYPSNTNARPFRLRHYPSFEFFQSCPCKGDSRVVDGCNQERGCFTGVVWW